MLCRRITSHLSHIWNYREELYRRKIKKKQTELDIISCNLYPLARWNEEIALSGTHTHPHTYNYFATVSYQRPTNPTTNITLSLSLAMPFYDVSYILHLLPYETEYLSDAVIHEYLQRTTPHHKTTHQTKFKQNLLTSI